MAVLGADDIRPGTSYRHEAFFYRTDAEYLAGTVPLVRDGIAAGEPVMVALPLGRLDQVRAALGADAEHVRFADMTDLGRNPAQIIPAWTAFIEEAGSDGRPLRGIGEPVWPGRSADEVAECQLHEALLNLAVSPDVPMWLRCPYDASALPCQVLQAAHLSHPLLADTRKQCGSLTYGGAHHAAALLTQSLPEPDSDVQEVPFGPQDLHRLRRVVGLHAEAAQVPQSRAVDLALAVHELAANSVEHGGGEGVLLLWRQADALVCEVRDAGVIGDPLVGRRGATEDAEGGRGVWMANQLCDLVQLRSSPGGTAVRVLVYLPPETVAA